MADSEFKGKKILVTGAAGFIGSHLVDRLLAEGAAKVVGLDNLVAGSRANLREAEKHHAFQWRQGDVCDAALMDKLVPEMDVVFNLAASKLVVSRDNPWTDLNTNIIGPFNVLQAARRNKTRVVHASTGSTLGSSDKPMREDHPKRPTTLYGISKAAAEEYGMFYAREFGVPATVIRYFHVYGPRQDYAGEAGVINIFLSRVLRGLPPEICGTGEQIRCFTFVLDDVAATMALARTDKSIGEIYNVASSVRLSVNELARMIIERYAKKPVKAAHIAPRPGENMRPEPDTSKIELLGFHTQTAFDAGLDLTRQWIESDMKEKGLL